LIALIARDIAADLMVFSEAQSIRPSSLLPLLTSETGATFVAHRDQTESRIRLFSRLSHQNIWPLVDMGTITARRVAAPGCLPIIMVAAHSQSRMYWSEPTDRLALAARVRRVLERAEAIEGHSRSFIVGDFNSDPYEDSMMTSEGLHAVMCRKVAAGISRRVDKRERPFLFNPIWSLLGDRRGPPGSYYYAKSTASCRFWHSFDQLLLRPPLIDALDETSLSFLTNAGSISLLDKNGRPDAELASDHLPLAFRLKLLDTIPAVEELSS
jgi:hypothetical protein